MPNLNSYLHLFQYYEGAGNPKINVQNVVVNLEKWGVSENGWIDHVCVKIENRILPPYCPHLFYPHVRLFFTISNMGCEPTLGVPFLFLSPIPSDSWGAVSKLAGVRGCKNITVWRGWLRRRYDPHAKIQTDCPSGGVPKNGGNITLVWFLFFSFFVSPNTSVSRLNKRTVFYAVWFTGCESGYCTSDKRSFRYPHFTPKKGVHTYRHLQA